MLKFEILHHIIDLDEERTLITQQNAHSILLPIAGNH